MKVLISVALVLGVGLVFGAVPAVAGLLGHALPQHAEMEMYEVTIASLLGAGLLIAVSTFFKPDRGITCRPGERIRYNIGG